MHTSSAWRPYEQAVQSTTQAVQSTTQAVQSTTQAVQSTTHVDWHTGGKLSQLE